VALIKVSSTRGDYVLINLEQVAWATIEERATSGTSRVTLHMVDGATFQLRDAEAEAVLAGLQTNLTEPGGAGHL
jgi:hypothetical protein